MGSTLEIESEFGVGSTFGFTLIQKILDDTPANKTMAPISYKSNFSREYKESFTAPDAKILLVDDTPINRKVIKNLLKATQVQISEASSGFEAIELCKQTRYDLILLDHLMPEMDGVETLASLMNNEDIPNFDTPVIALTANKSEHSKEYYEARGFRAYVSKPVHPAILEEAVRNNLPKTLIK